MFAQKYITTDIVKTVHGVNPDFDDLHEALDWVSQYIITQSGSVTFLVAAGQHVYTTTVEINHPNSNRIFIQGSPLVGGTPIRADFSVTGYHSSGDATNQAIMLRARYATELQFTGGITGFRTLSGGATLRYLLITGSQDILGGDPPGPLQHEGNGIHMYEMLWVDGVSIWGFGNIGISIQETTLRSETTLSCTVSYCWEGLDGRSAEVRMDYCEFIITSCSICGVAAFGGSYWIGKLTIRGTNSTSGNAALEVEVGAQFNTGPLALISTNFRSGIICAGASTLLCQSSTITGNLGSGVWCFGGGTMWINNTALGSNGEDITITGMSYIEAYGATWSTANLATNVQGNANSWIAW